MDVNTYENYYGYINPLSASVALIQNPVIDLHSKSIDWLQYEGNIGT